MPTFTLPFAHSEIAHWAGRYSYPGGDGDVIAVGERAKKVGYLTHADFLDLATWKSQRPTKHYLKNSVHDVEQVTRFAFAVPNERLRLVGLTMLHGVGERTASAILHFCHKDPYPLMDVRAFGTLGLTKAPTNWAEVWWPYTEACRKIAAEAGVSMRTLDQALWAYSEINGVVAE